MPPHHSLSPSHNQNPNPNLLFLSSAPTHSAAATTTFGHHCPHWKVAARRALVGNLATVAAPRSATTTSSPHVLFVHRHIVENSMVAPSSHLVELVGRPALIRNCFTLVTRPPPSSMTHLDAATAAPCANPSSCVVASALRGHGATTDQQL